MEGTNKAHENGEATGIFGVPLTAQLGASLFCTKLTQFEALSNLRVVITVGRWGIKWYVQIGSKKQIGRHIF